MFFCHLLIYISKLISKNSFRNTIRDSNSLDPDQARGFVGSDLGSDCLQILSVDDTSKELSSIQCMLNGVGLEMAM